MSEQANVSRQDPPQGSPGRKAPPPRKFDWARVITLLGFLSVPAIGTVLFLGWKSTPQAVHASVPTSDISTADATENHARELPLIEASPKKLKRVITLTGRPDNASGPYIPSGTMPTTTGGRGPVIYGQPDTRARSNPPEPDPSALRKDRYSPPWQKDPSAYKPDPKQRRWDDNSPLNQ